MSGPSTRAGQPPLDPRCPLTEADLDEVATVRRGMRARGYEPLAIHGPWSLACARGAAGKAPHGANWQSGQEDRRLFGRDALWSYVASNTGLLLGWGAVPVQAIDFDIDGKEAMRAARAATRDFLPGSALVRYRSGSPRVAALLRCEPGALKARLRGAEGAVERLARGQQVVVHGVHASGSRLLWESERAPWTVSAESLPLLDEAAVGAMFDAIRRSGALGATMDLTGAKGRDPGRSGGGGIGPDESVAAELRESIAAEGGVVPGVRAFIRAVGARGTGRHDSLVTLAGHLVARGWPVAQARDLVLPEVDAAFGEGSWAREVDAALRHAEGQRRTRTQRGFSILDS